MGKKHCVWEWRWNVKNGQSLISKVVGAKSVKVGNNGIVWQIITNLWQNTIAICNSELDIDWPFLIIIHERSHKNLNVFFSLILCHSLLSFTVTTKS